jgi:hypothetical protein
MRRLQQRARLGVVAAASLVLLVLVLPQVATGIGLGSLVGRLTSSGGCGSSGSSGSTTVTTITSGSGSGSGSSSCGPPTLVPSPNSGLADGQSITVTGTGFTPFSAVGMVECKVNSANASGCDLSTLFEVGTDGSGSFTTTYTVSRVLDFPGKGNPVPPYGLPPGRKFDCAVSRCGLGAADLSDYSIEASASLAFNPQIPLALRGTVAPVDTVVTHTGVATIVGTVTCTQPRAVDINVELQQEYRRFNFTNGGAATVFCSGHTPWSVTVPPALGLFGVGTAVVQAEISTELGNSYRSLDFKRTVTLQSAKKK